ncbi:MAG: hypothetical protein HKN41_04595 [Ilumatobacter sp.]|nr:hypothetical protein [Ilumatobacter sp.]
MRSRPPRFRVAAVALAIVAMAGCSSDSADDDQLDPDGESVIDPPHTGTTLVDEPGGVTNQLDGVDGDVEDEPEVGND